MWRTNCALRSCRTRQCRVHVRIRSSYESNEILTPVTTPQNYQKVVQRSYAQPAGFNFPAKIAYKAPHAPIQPSTFSEGEHTLDQSHDAEGPFDMYLRDVVLKLHTASATDVATLYQQYRERANRVINLIIPYEETPAEGRRADIRRRAVSEADGQIGDGIVMVVHALLKPDGRLDKVGACSGFAIDTTPLRKGDSVGNVIITCAHTLDELFRHTKASDTQNPLSFSMIIAADGSTRRVKQVLSSMPRADVIALEIEATDAASPSSSVLRTLPLSPFPVGSGALVLTHLFSTCAGPPEVRLSQSRLPLHAQQLSETDLRNVEEPVDWLRGQAFRRYGAGTMLGYRSYTGLEVEAGIHASLPHILTSVLPTPGSSGGPLVCGKTGAVVGMISGRRMDNRVEGERGWGASAENIFEMFSLPGFVPSHKQ